MDGYSCARQGFTPTSPGFAVVLVAGLVRFQWMNIKWPPSFHQLYSKHQGEISTHYSHCEKVVFQTL